jgi:WD40 repeat protein
MRSSDSQSQVPDSLTDRFAAMGARFIRVFGGMCFLVGVLVVLEVVALWGMGVKYEPKQSIRKGSVGDFSLSADGRWAVSRLKLDRAGTLEQSVQVAICLHDMRSMGRVMPLEVGRHDISRVAIAPSGQQVAFASMNAKIYVTGRNHNLVSVTTIANLNHDVVASLNWSVNGQFLIAMGMDRVHIWTMPSGELAHSLEHGLPDRPSMSLCRDSRTLLVAGGDSLQLWDIATGRQLKSLSVQPDLISGPISSAISSGGELALVSSRDGGLLAWEIPSGRELWREVSPRWRQASIALSPDDVLVASIERRSMIGQWRDYVVVRSALTGDYLREFDADVGPVTGLTFSPDGTLCIWGDDGWISGWDVASRTERWRVSSLDGLR